jgi:ABC-type Co2+ transport system permease subunit
MSSRAADSSLVDVLLGPAFVVGVLLLAGLAYSVLVLQRLGPFLLGVSTLASLAVTAFVLWLLYRFVVAVEELVETVGRIERSLESARDDE